MARYRDKKEKNSVIKTILMILLVIVLIISLYKVIIWIIDSNKTNKLIDEINNIANIDETDDNDKTELINKDDDLNSDYWYYIKFPLINVNFSELKAKNSDTVAWINVNNTNINYPVVQTTNNDFYLNHSYSKDYNEAGWVFLDYRNNKDFSDKNNIIYAHSRLDKTMFGSLSRALNESWYQNKDNHIVRISNEHENSLWQIFSIYIIDTESYYVTTSFNNGSDYLKFLNTLKDRSKYNFNTTLSGDDRIITLSTCYDDSKKTVVHAKLIKRELR